MKMETSSSEKRNHESKACFRVRGPWANAWHPSWEMDRHAYPPGHASPADAFQDASNRRESRRAEENA